MPCRNVLPKPVQKPHPPMWIACTNRDTIKVAAKNGLGALAFSFIDPEEARAWSKIYYDIIKSDECVPLGHTVNANLAMVSNFSVHKDRAEAIRRGHEGFEFFRYALNALVAHDTVPGRTNSVGRVSDAARQSHRRDRRGEPAGRNLFVGHRHARRHEAAFEGFQEAGVDQVIFMQQAGRNKHQHICESLELFASDVMRDFKAEVAAREARKAAELAPFIAGGAGAQKMDEAARRGRSAGRQGVGRTRADLGNLASACRLNLPGGARHCPPA